MDKVWLHRLSVLVAGVTLSLVAAGALVTSRDAALSVPDWPLSYGRLIPPLDGNVVYEFAHRALAAVAGLLTLALALWTSRAERRAWVVRLAWMAVTTIALQAVLGGITVRMAAPRTLRVFHSGLAQLQFVLAVTLALALSRGWRQAPQRVDDDGRPSLHVACVLALAAMFVQSLLGATVRHGVVGVAPHIVGAACATLAVMWASLRIAGRHMEHRALRRAAVWALSLVFSQVFLGLAAYMSRVVTAGAPQPMPLMIWGTVAHVAAGAVAMAACTVMTLEVFRHVRRPARAVAQEGIAVA